MADADPIERFAALLEQAKRIDRALLPEPTAFALGTVGDDGQPAVRIMLLKGVDERGFVFFTNYESRKGRELLASRKAALTFHWQHLEIQVRVEGSVTTVSDAEADAYFATRPRGSQLGAWASRQSRAMSKPLELEERLVEFEQKFAGQPVPRPAHWSGFRVVPHRIEFWRNMPSRLHQRECYVRDGSSWTVERLFP